MNSQLKYVLNNLIKLHFLKYIFNEIISFTEDEDGEGEEEEEGDD